MTDGGLLVVDASVVGGLVAPHRADDPLFDIVLDRSLHAPEFLHVEAANIVWKAARLAGETWAVVVARLVQIESLPIRLHADRPLARKAFEMARTLAHPVYDCLYLALALELDAQVLTRDRRFAAAAEAAHPGRVRALG
jgi:predicted nucleic acid-binding protein